VDAGGWVKTVSLILLIGFPEVLILILYPIKPARTAHLTFSLVTHNWNFISQTMTQNSYDSIPGLHRNTG
jgi:hypothetical protein